MEPGPDHIYQQVVVATPTDFGHTPTEPTNKAENVLCGDDAVDDSDRDRCRTPLAIRRAWAQDQLATFGKDVTVFPRIRIRHGFKPWNSTAHLEIDSSTLANPIDQHGLHLRFWVACNPAYMCQPHDLVPIYLETALNQFRLMVIALQPTWDNNYFEVEVDYPLAQLARILKLQQPGRDLLAAVTNRYRELGLRAQWMGVQGQTLPQANGVQHESGGLDQKNGSGKIRLAPYGEDELAATESRRCTSWNMSEKLTAARPVFQKFGEALQAGKEMMTSLEAESEYLLPDREALDRVIDAMSALAEDPEQQRKYLIVKMSQKKKEYTDSYFDLDGLPLLDNQLVLRRRHVDGDEPGTFLFAVKGASFRHIRTPREKLRLAAQVQLQPQLFDKPDEPQRSLLRRFLTTATTDNAFARVIDHALRAQNRDDVLTRLEKEDIAVALTVRSTRYTFQMSLSNGTVIDFSADLARAEHEGEHAEVFSFEFGVGHPALTQAATATGLASASTTGKVAAMVRQADSRPSVVRPYHVPKDLENITLFARADYKQYKTLRDALIKRFGLEQDTLEPGGNKARELAKALGMLGS